MGLLLCGMTLFGLLVIHSEYSHNHSNSTAKGSPKNWIYVLVAPSCEGYNDQPGNCIYAQKNVPDHVPSASWLSQSYNHYAIKV